MRSSDKTIRLDRPRASQHTQRIPAQRPHRARGSAQPGRRPQGPPPAHRPQPTPPPSPQPPVRQEPVPDRPRSKPVHQSPQKGKRKAPPGCGCLVSLVFIFLILLAAFAGYWVFSARQVPPPISSLPEAEQQAEALDRASRNTAFLLVGDDERAAGEQARSDTMLYMVLRPVDKKIGLLSFPRDSLVNIPGYGEDKLNAAFAYGGMDLLTKTVTDLTDAPIDHTCLINFSGFEKMVDAIGGVTIDVPQKMYKPEEGIDLEPGKQKLNGHDALAFVRWRDDGLGDIGRMERQKEFISAFAKECRFLWPWQVARLGWAIHTTVETDLSPLESLKLVVDMAGMGKEAVEVDHLTLDPEYINGISYVLLDPGDVHRTIQRISYGVELNKS